VRLLREAGFLTGVSGLHFTRVIGAFAIMEKHRKEQRRTTYYYLHGEVVLTTFIITPYAGTNKRKNPAGLPSWPSWRLVDFISSCLNRYVSGQTGFFW